MLLGLLAPVLKALAVDYLRRDPLVVKVIERVFIDQNISPPSAIFQRFDFVDQRAVMSKEGTFGVKFPFHQRTANKQLPGLLGRDWPVMYLAPRHNRQTKQRDLFKGHYLGALHFPMRFAVAAFNQVLRLGFNPLGIDFGHGAGKQLGGFHHLERHDPLGRLLGQP